jgi:hypothetical protein
MLLDLFQNWDSIVICGKLKGLGVRFLGFIRNIEFLFILEKV